MRELDADDVPPPCVAAVRVDEGPDGESREAAAFRQMFEALFDDLARFARRRVPDEAVDDVVAETLLVAWRRFADLPTDPADRRPWLFGVARNVLANTHRGRRRSGDLTVRLASQPQLSADDDASQVASRVDLARAFERLGSRDQEALVLVAWDGLTPTESARVLGISTSAFSVRLSRARQRLRKHIEPNSIEGAER